MKDIFNKSPRRMRKEKKEREKQRQQEKEKLQNLRKMFQDKRSKINHMKRVEKSKSFQSDFKKMKNLLINPKPIEPSKKRPMNDFVKDYNIFGKNDDFMKTKKKAKTEDDFWRL